MKQTSKTIFPVICLSFVLNGYYLTTLSKTLANISAQYGLDNTAMGLLMSVQFIAMIVLSLPFGRLGDKIGKKKIYYIQSVCFLAGMFMISFAPNMAVVVTGIFFGGVGYGLMGFIASSIITDAYPEKAAKYMVLSNAVFSLGAITAPFVADGLINGGMPWRQVYVIIGVAGVLSFVLLLFTKIEKTKIEDVHAEAELSMGKLLKSPIMLLIGLAMLMYMGMETGTSSFIDKFFTNSLGSPELSALCLSVMWFMMMPSRLIISFKKGKKYPIMIGSFLLAFAMGILITVIKNPVFNIVAFGAIGFAFGPVWPFLLSMASRVFYANSGMAAGVVSMASGIGGALLPPLIGLVADSAGYGSIFLIVSVLAIVGVAAYGGAVRIVKKRGVTDIL